MQNCFPYSELLLCSFSIPWFLYNLQTTDEIQPYTDQPIQLGQAQNVVNHYPSQRKYAFLSRSRHKLILIWSLIIHSSIHTYPTIDEIHIDIDQLELAHMKNTEDTNIPRRKNVMFLILIWVKENGADLKIGHSSNNFLDHITTDKTLEMDETSSSWTPRGWRKWLWKRTNWENDF
jgi:hypothetical protein